jgi:exportin-7
VFEVMSLGEMTQIMNVVVNKLCNNIKFWHAADAILEQTLDVFIDLVTSYGSSKTLLSLETVNFLVLNHTGQHFPFLGYDSDNKYRVVFYAALSRLVFSAAEDLNNSFDAFIEPNLEILRQLSQAGDLRDRSVRVALLGCLRDLRGITSATHNKRTYSLLFDALYPDFFPLFRRVADAWYDDHNVMTALLKYMQVWA